MPIKALNIKLLQIIIIFSFGVLLYVNTWDFDFASDDTMMITDNKFTKGGIEGIYKIFTTDAFAGFLGEGKHLLSGGRYRPLSQVIFNIEYSLFGLSPSLWHIQNTLLFALAMVLVYLSLLKLFNTTKIQWHSLAFITTLIATAHPLNTEVVANIKSLDLILSLLFSFIALFYSLKYYDTEKLKYLAIIFISLFLGTLSKETSLTFLGVIPLSILFFRRFERKELLAIIGTLAFSIITYFVLRIYFVGIPRSIDVTELLNNPFLEATIGEKYATIIYTWWHYIELYIFPHNLTHDYYPYTIGITNWGNTVVITTLVLFVSTTLWSLWKLYNIIFNGQYSNYVAFGWLFFIFVFSISSNLFVSIGAFMNERFIFIADIGLAIIMAYFILYASKRANQPQFVSFAIAIPLISLFSLITISRNYAWQDDYTLFTTDVKVSANSAKCNVSAGGKSYEKAKNTNNKSEKEILLRDAETYLKKGIKIYPKYTQAYTLLGNVYFVKGEYTKSFANYIHSVELGETKDSKTNILALGIKTHQEQKYNLSNTILEYYEKEYSANSNSQYYIADNYLHMNNMDTSILILINLIKNDSKYAEAYNKLGEIYGRYLNDMQLSELYLLKGYEIEPINASICENLGVLNGIKGNLQKSIFFFEKAIDNSEKPSKQLLQNLENTYRNAGIVND
ncbi:MAG: glycosyltransferase family 39 protein [Bacteroidales bacterium]|nr:glycosyltransferase family 39 protein [Bacteroidales bacterium]